MAPKYVRVLPASWAACAVMSHVVYPHLARGWDNPFRGGLQISFFFFFSSSVCFRWPRWSLGKADLISRLVKVRFAHRGGNILTSTMMGRALYSCQIRLGSWYVLAPVLEASAFPWCSSNNAIVTATCNCRLQLAPFRTCQDFSEDLW